MTQQHADNTNLFVLIENCNLIYPGERQESESTGEQDWGRASQKSSHSPGNQ
jgi:hypothetical protein